ncbi:MAG: hypothetical protein KBG46_13325 [Paracoccus sp.]|jgi:hypothetical protein|nr:hypothetical protein [Paracoccus sp. (in: a-proteobacteria)]
MKIDLNATRDAEEVIAPLSLTEIVALRRLLAVARYDVAQAALVLDTGKARILVRDDGTVRCEGKSVTVIADGVITMDGAAIELN